MGYAAPDDGSELWVHYRPGPRGENLCGKPNPVALDAHYRKLIEQEGQ